MTECKYLIDSSIWVSYFLSEKEEISTFIESSHEMFTPILSLFEVKRKFIREKYNQSKIDTALELMQRRGSFLPITWETCQRAAELSVHHNLAAMDALIYATAPPSVAQCGTRN